MKHRALGLVLGLAAGLLSGCGAGNALRQRMDALDTRLGKIEPAAMRCDEHSLAVARAHLYFAEVELEQGAAQAGR